MAERKVLNKYYPPDFDPAKIPKRRKPKNQQMKVRNMLPMDIQCKKCGDFIGKGTKFNMRKEDVIGETYLDEIQKYRFYFKCKKCSAEITMKTDPQNSDYTVESGAARISEPWRAKDEVCEEKRRKRDAEERGDAMKSLENRTLDSKRDMDILSNLDEIKSMKSRHARVSNDAMLVTLQRSVQVQQKEKLGEEDEALIKSIFHGSKENIRRIDDDKLDDTYDTVSSGFDGSRTSQAGSNKRKPTESPFKSSVIKFVKKSSKPKTQTSEENKKASVTSNVSKSLRQQYDEE
ncbi:hypothetical protein CTI12_AA197430 [Artemisia annua]|uniref:Splicing factor YJU2 n=1 Tax=Artemisia annua TaxID=35608 RepID=A0A2U1P3V8_ARTAN|nr:hypothetical protein CTI12_AA197430 [Artemisia annua]